MVLTDKPHLMCVTSDTDSLHWGGNRLKGLVREIDYEKQLNETHPPLILPPQSKDVAGRLKKSRVG